jgi:hypothetical protein
MPDNSYDAKLAALALQLATPKSTKETLALYAEIQRVLDRARCQHSINVMNEVRSAQSPKTG